MSIDYCGDCERIVEGNTTIVFFTESMSAYQDGEYTVTCGYCGNDNVFGLTEDDPREDR